MQQNKNYIIFNDSGRGLALDFESPYPSDFYGDKCNTQLRELLTDEDLRKKLMTLFVVTLVEHHGCFDKIIETIIKNKLNLHKLGIGAAIYPDYEKGSYISDDFEMDGSSWQLSIPNLFALIHSLPKLEQLVIQANKLSTGNNYSDDSDHLNHSNLKSLTFRIDSTEPKFFHVFGKACLPNLRHLEITLGNYFYSWGESANIFENLFNNKNFNSLEHFTCKCDFANDIMLKLKDSLILKQIKIIDISDSNLNDEGAEFILANWNNFEHLELLDISNNCIPQNLLVKLEEKSGAIQTGYQRFNIKKERVCDSRKTVIF